MRHQRALRRSGRAARVDRAAPDRSRDVVDRREARRRALDQRFERRDERLARAGDADDMRERRAAVRGSARGWAATADRRTRPSPRCWRAGTRARRDRTGTTAAPRPRRAGRRPGARRPSPAAAAGSARPCRRARRPSARERVREPVGLASRGPRSERGGGAGLVFPVEREARRGRAPSGAQHASRDVERAPARSSGSAA